MTNYLLSIDPSIKNTGFTLWELDNKHDINLTIKIIKNNKLCDICGWDSDTTCWKPIWIRSYSFKKHGNDNFNKNIHYIPNRFLNINF